MRWLNLKEAASFAALAAALALPAPVRGQVDSGEARFACLPADAASGFTLAFAVPPSSESDYMAAVVLTAADSRSYSWRGIALRRTVWDFDRGVVTDIIRLDLDDEGDYAELHAIRGRRASDGIRFESRIRASAILSDENPARLLCVPAQDASGQT